jgi:hypothetical protein
MRNYLISPMPQMVSRDLIAGSEIQVIENCRGWIAGCDGLSEGEELLCIFRRFLLCNPRDYLELLQPSGP